MSADVNFAVRKAGGSGKKAVGFVPPFLFAVGQIDRVQNPIQIAQVDDAVVGSPPVLRRLLCRPGIPISDRAGRAAWSRQHRSLASRHETMSTVAGDAATNGSILALSTLTFSWSPLFVTRGGRRHDRPGGASQNCQQYEKVRTFHQTSPSKADQSGCCGLFFVEEGNGSANVGKEPIRPVGWEAAAANSPNRSRCTPHSESRSFKPACFKTAVT